MTNNETQSQSTQQLSTIELINAAEINQQIATAKKFPRSITEFHRRARELALHNAEIALQCTYQLKRTDADGQSKPIIGPSVRFAEIIAMSFYNCRYAARVVGENAEFVIAQGVFHDLESNVQVGSEVHRRITTREGRRYSPDMIGVTSNAACSIALRNAVFKGVPKALWADLWHETQRVARGDEKTLKARCENMLVKFRDELKVKPEEIYATLGIKGFEDIGVDELMQLGWMYTSIADGDTSADAVFRAKPDESASVAATDELNATFGLTGKAP